MILSKKHRLEFKRETLKKGLLKSLNKQQKNNLNCQKVEPVKLLTFSENKEFHLLN
jgi:hypothetical protein